MLQNTKNPNMMFFQNWKLWFSMANGKFWSKSKPKKEAAVEEDSGTNSQTKPHGKTEWYNTLIKIKPMYFIITLQIIYNRTHAQNLWTFFPHPRQKSIRRRKNCVRIRDILQSTTWIRRKAMDDVCVSFLRPKTRYFLTFLRFIFFLSFLMYVRRDDVWNFM